MSRYWNDDHERRDCEVLERNGSLTYVEDTETGERSWVDHRDVEGEDE